MATRESWPAATILGRLPAAARNVLLDSGTQELFPAGEMLLRQGARGEFALLLTTGCVKIVSYLENRDDTHPRRSPVLAVRVAGDLIGEMAALDGKPRSATVVTATRVSARRIGKARLTKLIQDHPEIGSAIRFVANERLRWANRRRIDIASEQARVCLARVLIDIAGLYGQPGSDEVTLDVSLTQTDFASLAGVSRSSTEKVFRSLRSDGLIRTGRRRVTITDLTGLREVAQITLADY